MARWPLLLLPLFLSLVACSTRFVDYGEGYSNRHARSATATRGAMPPRGRLPQPDYHTVRKGETLYSIAWQYGLDYRTMAARNGIRPPYTIYPGQRLRVKAGRRAAKSAKRVTKSTAAKAKPARSAKAAPRRAPASATAKPLHWRWPVRGKVIRRFKAGDPRRQGIDIAGRAGTPVRAAAGGKVVYSGNGLRGYGNLVIIKHNDIWFSAYAHNRRIRVRENDEVKAGQTIADMGSTGTDRVKLHFEIRRNGKPVDPLRYLPPEG